MAHPHKLRYSTPPAPEAPLLTPDDRARLKLYLELDQDAAALAAARGEDLLDTALWLDSPPIRRALAAIDRAQSRHAAAQAARDRQTALSALKDALHAASTPIERRRAATPLLRALDKPSPSPRGMDSGGLPMSTPPTKAPPTDSPTHAGDEPTPPSSSVSSSTANPRVSPSPHSSPSEPPTTPEAHHDSHPHLPSSLLALLLNPTSILNTPSSATPHNPFPTASPSTPAARLLARAGAAHPHPT